MSVIDFALASRRASYRCCTETLRQRSQLLMWPVGQDVHVGQVGRLSVDLSFALLADDSGRPKEMLDQLQGGQGEQQVAAGSLGYWARHVTGGGGGGKTPAVAKVTISRADRRTEGFLLAHSRGKRHVAALTSEVSLQTKPVQTTVIYPSAWHANEVVVSKVVRTDRGELVHLAERDSEVNYQGEMSEEAIAALSGAISAMPVPVGIDGTRVALTKVSTHGDMPWDTEGAVFYEALRIGGGKIRVSPTKPIGTFTGADGVQRTGINYEPRPGVDPADLAMPGVLQHVEPITADQLQADRDEVLSIVRRQAIATGSTAVAATIGLLYSRSRSERRIGR